jgi:hypothetical protein
VNAIRSEIENRTHHVHGLRARDLLSDERVGGLFPADAYRLSPLFLARTRARAEERTHSAAPRNNETARPVASVAASVCFRWNAVVLDKEDRPAGRHGRHCRQRR